MKTICYLLLFGALVLSVHSQNLDSLRQALEASPPDTALATGWSKLASQFYSHGRPVEAEAAARQGLALSQGLNFPKGEARNQLWLIGALGMQGRLDEALAAARKAQYLARRVGDSRLEANALQGLAMVHRNQGRFDSARHHFRETSRLLAAQHRWEDAAYPLEGVATIYLVEGNLPQALDAFAQALRLLERSTDPIRLPAMARCLTGMASVHTKNENHVVSEGLLRRALAVLDSAGPKAISRAQVLFGLQKSLELQGRMAESLPLLYQSHELAQRTNDQLVLVYTAAKLAEIHLEAGHLDSARVYVAQSEAAAEPRPDQLEAGVAALVRGRLLAREGRWPACRAKAQQAQDLFARFHDLHGQIGSLGMLVEADSALGNLRSALACLRQQHACRDSLTNAETVRRLSRQQAELEAEQARVLRETQFAAAQRQSRWLLGAAAGVLLFVGLLAFNFFRGRRSQQRANRQLQALNLEIGQQKAEIEAQHSEISAQRDQLESANRQLVALDRLKEQLTGMIVHDLKNPLNAVLAMSSLPPQAERLQVIRSAGQQMSQLILNLLDIQKYEDAAMVLQPQPVYAADLLQQATTQVEFLAEQRQITWSSEADRQLVVNADAELIVRVLVNLLTNAIKYAPAGDVLALEVAFDPARGAVFRLTDHGPGIPADLLDRIFDRFSQVDGGKASGKLRSTGLGLTFCRLTIEAHGGRIEAQSEVGRYTTFTFNLPKAHRSAYASEALPAATRTPEPGPLPPAFWADYQPIQTQLRATPFYLISEVMDRLAELPDAPDPWSAWKAAVEQAVFAGNVERFHELLA